MPSKNSAPGSLAFLAESAKTIYVVCLKCNRFTVADLHKIAKRGGWRANTQEIGKRLRCTECKHRGAKLTVERPRVGRSVCARCRRPYQ